MSFPEHKEFLEGGFLLLVVFECLGFVVLRVSGLFSIRVDLLDDSESLRLFIALVELDSVLRRCPPSLLLMSISTSDDSLTGFVGVVVRSGCFDVDCVDLPT